MRLLAGIGVAWLLAVGPGSGHAFAHEPVRVAYRQLAANPDAYAGKRVRMPACAATAMHHGAYLYDCDDPHARIIALVATPRVQEALFGAHGGVETRRAAAMLSGMFEWRPDAPVQCCLDNRVLLHVESVSGVTRLPSRAGD